jgi:7-cyano-7-deazaguanine synthase
MPNPAETVAVLCSGGLDSAVLVAHAAREAGVLPVYVSVGLAWESVEREALARLASTPAFGGRVLPLTTLSLPMTDVYSPAHWAVRGVPPAYDTPDEDVYLVGRNISLLVKAGVLCAGRGIRRIWIGPLAGNPFPDATPAFFDAMSRALSLGLDRPIRIETPFAAWHKADVIRRGVELGVALEWSMSCMNPAGGTHCGRCSKCRERRDAFAEAGIPDPTTYAAPSPRVPGTTTP